MLVLELVAALSLALFMAFCPSAVQISQIACWPEAAHLFFVGAILASSARPYADALKTDTLLPLPQFEPSQ